MGLAEALPGISGGTIAYITGIYERMVSELAKFEPTSLFANGLRGAIDSILESRRFLVPWGVGMVLGFVCMLTLVTTLLVHAESVVWSFAFGLMLGGCVMIGSRSSGPWLLTYGVVGVLFGIWISLLHLTSDATEIVPLWLYFVGGFVAFAAWILPGVSGSLILVILGVWADLLFQVRSLVWLPIAIFLCGVTLGALSLPKVLYWMFKNGREKLLALFSGLLLGSLLRVWPWHSLQGLPALPDALWEGIWGLLALLAGILLVLFAWHREGQVAS